MKNTKLRKKSRILALEFMILGVLLSIAILMYAKGNDLFNVTRSEYTTVNAKVITAEHTKAKSVYKYENIDGDVYKRVITKPASYKVVLQYGDLKAEYDTVAMYNKCKDKSTIKVQICTITSRDKTETKITDVY